LGKKCLQDKRSRARLADHEVTGIPDAGMAGMNVLLG
jgi:hypothetical protein